MRGKRPVAELRPVPAGRRLADLPGMIASLPRLTVAEAEHLAEELEAARTSLGSLPADPWASS